MVFAVNYAHNSIYVRNNTIWVTSNKTHGLTLLSCTFFSLIDTQSIQTLTALKAWFTPQLLWSKKGESPSLRINLFYLFFCKIWAVCWRHLWLWVPLLEWLWLKFTYSIVRLKLWFVTVLLLDFNNRTYRGVCFTLFNAYFRRHTRRTTILRVVIVVSNKLTLLFIINFFNLFSVIFVFSLNLLSMERRGATTPICRLWSICLKL